MSTLSLLSACIQHTRQIVNTTTITSRNTTQGRAIDTISTHVGSEEEGEESGGEEKGTEGGGEGEGVDALHAFLWAESEQSVYYYMHFMAVIV